jgi:hypothetical protein
MISNYRINPNCCNFNITVTDEPGYRNQSSGFFDYKIDIITNPDLPEFTRINLDNNGDPLLCMNPIHFFKPIKETYLRVTGINMDFLLIGVHEDLFIVNNINPIDYDTNSYSIFPHRHPDRSFVFTNFPVNFKILIALTIVLREQRIRLD